MRIELSEPLPAAPYFAAVTLAFLEPLDPVFSLKLETALLPEGLTIPIVKPILTNILSDKVFAVHTPPPICQTFCGGSGDTRLFHNLKLHEQSCARTVQIVLQMLKCTAEQLVCSCESACG